MVTSLISKDRLQDTVERCTAFPNDMWRLPAVTVRAMAVANLQLLECVEQEPLAYTTPLMLQALKEPGTIACSIWPTPSKLAQIPIYLNPVPTPASPTDASGLSPEIADLLEEARQALVGVIALDEEDEGPDGESHSCAMTAARIQIVLAKDAKAKAATKAETR